MLSFFLHGQTTLKGTYKESTEGGHTVMKFSSNNRFYIDASSDIKKWTGSGTYKIKNNHLLLYFTKADSTKNKDGSENWPEPKENWKIIKVDETQLILQPGDTWHLKKVN